MTAGAVQEGGPAPLAASSSPVKIVAVGDIACPASEPTTSRNCREAQTARLTKRLAPKRVLALGDLQYSRGTATEFRNSYAKSWGSLKSITQPLPGNHEYESRGAAGYYSYFDQKAPGYYAWNAGTWRIYNLNSNCDKINCEAEETWLRKDLDNNPHKCTIVAMHHPRWSSGLEHGSQPSVGPVLADRLQPPGRRGAGRPRPRLRAVRADEPVRQGRGPPRHPVVRLRRRRQVALPPRHP